MKQKDLDNLLNRAAAGLEAFANADAVSGRQGELTSVEVQELIEDLLAAATPTIRQVNGRFTCTNCGYDWSAAAADDEVPEVCDCCKPM